MARSASTSRRHTEHTSRWRAAHRIDAVGDEVVAQDVLATAIGAATSEVPAQALSNATQAAAQVFGGAVTEPAVASIYQLDSIVRRATSLQLTADARQAREGGAA